MLYQSSFHQNAHLQCPYAQYGRPPGPRHHSAAFHFGNTFHFGAIRSPDIAYKTLRNLEKLFCLLTMFFSPVVVSAKVRFRKKVE